METSWSGGYVYGLCRGHRLGPDHLQESAGYSAQRERGTQGIYLWIFQGIWYFNVFVIRVTVGTVSCRFLLIKSTTRCRQKMWCTRYVHVQGGHRGCWQLSVFGMVSIGWFIYDSYSFSIVGLWKYNISIMSCEAHSGLLRATMLGSVIWDCELSEMCNPPTWNRFPVCELWIVWGYHQAVGINSYHILCMSFEVHGYCSELNRVVLAKICLFCIF